MIKDANKRYRPLGTLAAAGTISLVLALLGTVHGAPLPLEDCQKLSAEHTALIAAGIADQMTKGPAWAKDNLPAAKLAEIQRYITIDEQLAFRCGMGRIKLDIPDDETPAEVEGKTSAKLPGKVVKSPAPKSPGVKRPAAKTPAAAAPTRKPGAATKAAVTAAPRASGTPAKGPVLPLVPKSADASRKAPTPPAVAAPKPKAKPKTKPPETDDKPS